MYRTCIQELMSRSLVRPQSDSEGEAESLEEKIRSKVLHCLWSCRCSDCCCEILWSVHDKIVTLNNMYFENLFLEVLILIMLKEKSYMTV